MKLPPTLPLLIIVLLASSITADRFAGLWMAFCAGGFTGVELFDRALRRNRERGDRR